MQEILEKLHSATQAYTRNPNSALMDRGQGGGGKASGLREVHLSPDASSQAALQLTLVISLVFK
jgi:hypothetical protein